MGCSPWGGKELDKTDTHTHTEVGGDWPAKGRAAEGVPHSCRGLAEVGTTVGLGLPRVGQMWPPHILGSVGPQEMPVQLAKTTPHPTTFPNPNYSLKLAGSQRGARELQPTFKGAQEEGKKGRVDPTEAH